MLPLDNQPLFAILNPPPSNRMPRSMYVFRQGGSSVPESVAVNVRDRSHSIRADVDVPDGVVPSGVLLAMGSALGGFALYLKDGCLRYVHNLYGAHRDVIGSTTVVPPGPHHLEFVFTRTDRFAGAGELRIDGEPVGAGEIPRFTPMSFSYTGGGVTCGYETGPAVGDDYVAPFEANVTIARVVVEVVGDPNYDPLAEFRAIMTEQ